MTIDNTVGELTSTGRMVREKLSNLMYLTRCGFYDHLEEGASEFVLIWACSAVLTEPTTIIFQIAAALEQNMNERPTT